MPKVKSVRLLMNRKKSRFEDKMKEDAALTKKKDEHEPMEAIIIEFRDLQKKKEVDVKGG